MDKDKFIVFFKKRIEPYMALGVFIMLIILSVQLYNGNELRKEISKNCGWEDENYRCFCEKSEAMAIKNKIDNNFSFNIDEVEYVQMDR